MKFLEDSNQTNSVLMCPPTYFSIDYQINPWMTGSVDSKLAQHQWENLYHLYQKIGVRVKTLSPVPGLPDMVFTTDQGTILGQQVFVSHFRYPQRSPESAFFRQFLKSQNLKSSPFPLTTKFEGGDCLRQGSRLFIGQCFRTSTKFISRLRKKHRIEAISLKLVNPFFYHLDTCLFILNQAVAFCYPQAFSQRSLEKLKKYFTHLYFFSDTEAFNLSANSLTTDHRVVIQKNNPHFKNQLTKLGYYVHEIDVSEFFKSGGGIRCLTLRLN